MNRYYLVRDEHMPTIKEMFSGMNYIDLVTHGPAGDQWNLVCLPHPHVDPKKEWIPLPKITDSQTTLAEWDMPHEVLADIGLDGSETCMQAVYKFEGIYPAMG